MTLASMCGVVLWSSAEEQKAVIWCEDHGNLAFYAPKTESAFDGVALDPGDLIQFDMEDCPQHRRAHNPRLLVENHAPMIAADLQRDAARIAQTHSEKPAAQTNNVVAFPQKGTRHELRLKAI